MDSIDSILNMSWFGNTHTDFSFSDLGPWIGSLLLKAIPSSGHWIEKNWLTIDEPSSGHGT